MMFFLYFLVIILYVLSLETQYDLIVIGSGISGLSAASTGVSMKKKVLLLEKSPSLGGSLNQFSRTVQSGNEYTFAVGLHFSVNISGMLSLYAPIVSTPIKWNLISKSDDIVDQLMIENRSYEVHRNYETFLSYLKKKFPLETKTIDKFVDIMQTTKDRDTSIKQLVTSSELGIKNNDLKLLLCHNFALIGDERIDLVLFQSVMDIADKGYFYPDEGGEGIVRNVAQKIKSGNGNIISNCEVSKILFNENDEVEGVEACNKQIFRSPNVLSTIGAKNTFNSEFLPQEIVDRYNYTHKLDHESQTFPAFNVWIGFNKSSEEIGISERNYFIFEKENYLDINRDYLDQKEPFEKYNFVPMIFATTSANKDSSYPKGRSDIMFLMSVSYEWFRKYENSTVGKRDKEYYLLKQKFEDYILGVLEKYVSPKAKNYIDVIVSGSPLTYRDFLSHPYGSVYGLFKKMSNDWVSEVTPVKGLYLSGQDVGAAGVQTSVFLGMDVVSRIFP